MRKINQERLGKLANVIGRLDPDDINMKVWHCDTFACALGWYSISQEGKEDGWETYNEGRAWSKVMGGTPMYCFNLGYEAAKTYFGLTNTEVAYLFSPASYSGLPQNHIVAAILAHIRDVKSKKLRIKED